jgi:uncharacterized protein
VYALFAAGSLQPGLPGVSPRSGPIEYGLHREFRPLFANPHLATIAGNFWPREIDTARFPPTVRDYHINPNTTIRVLQHEPAQSPRGQFVFVHGLEGSADAGYIRSMAQAALERGFGVHRTNLRSCGGTEHLSDTMYHSGLTSDTRFILEKIRQRFDGIVVLVGFSLGGNVTLKLAGELGAGAPLSAACAVSTPIDLAACVGRLDRPANYLYARRFLSRLKARVVRKSELAPALYPVAGIDQVTSVWDFDDRFTGPLFGFGDAANYYRTQSAQNFLADIRVPTLVIQAKDDPLIPFSVYEQEAFSTNPSLELLAVPRGGHLGFLSRQKPRFWLDAVVLEWAERLIPAQPQQNEDRYGTNPVTLTSD